MDQHQTTLLPTAMDWDTDGELCPEDFHRFCTKGLRRGQRTPSSPLQRLETPNFDNAPGIVGIGGERHRVGIRNSKVADRSTLFSTPLQQFLQQHGRHRDCDLLRKFGWVESLGHSDHAQLVRMPKNEQTKRGE